MATGGLGLHTPVCDVLGIETPILQAGMATYTSAELVAAVSNAGGLGILGSLGRAADDLRTEIARTRQLTSRPFGVNHVISQLDPEAFAVTMEQRPPVLSLAWGTEPTFAEQARERGMRVVHQVTTPEEAQAAMAGGADVIVAQGTEGGGHVGGISTLPFVPAVVDIVGATPVLAAGGIADGRGLAAALMLGAQGTLIGTRFLATPEAPVSQRLREALLASSVSETIATKFFDDVLGLDWPGAQLRALRNPLLDEWAGRPVDWRAAVNQLQPVLGEALSTGEFVLAGEASGLVHDVVPAGTLVRRITEEAFQLLRSSGTEQAPAV